MRALAEPFVDGRLSDEALSRMTDDEVEAALTEVSGKDLEWNGQVVIDATNDCAADDLNGRTSSELVADLVVGALLVKAANTLSAEVLGSDPHEAGGRRVMLVSGGDAEA